MRELLYMSLNIWLSTIGGLLGIIGKLGVWSFGLVKRFGVAIVEYSFKYDP